MPPQGQLGKSSEIPENSSHDTESFPLSQRVTTSTAVDCTTLRDLTSGREFEIPASNLGR